MPRIDRWVYGNIKLRGVSIEHGVKIICSNYILEVRSIMILLYIQKLVLRLFLFPEFIHDAQPSLYHSPFCQDRLLY